MPTWRRADDLTDRQSPTFSKKSCPTTCASSKAERYVQVQPCTTSRAPFDGGMTDRPMQCVCICFCCLLCPPPKLASSRCSAIQTQTQHQPSQHPTYCIPALRTCPSTLTLERIHKTPVCERYDVHWQEGSAGGAACRYSSMARGHGVRVQARWVGSVIESTSLQSFFGNICIRVEYLVRLLCCGGVMLDSLMLPRPG